MLSLPRVSVVIPTYNRAPLVGQAIESVRAQRMGEFELIVVDDGSTDDTQAVLHALAAAEPRLRIVRQENGGSGSARNAGVAQARATFVALLDSDDLWEPGFLTSQLAVFEAHPETGLVLSDARYVGDWNQASVTVFGREAWVPPTSLTAMFGWAFGLPSCWCVRTEILRELPFDSDARCLEDTDFLFRFHLAGHTLRQNPEVLAQYRRVEAPGVEAQIVADRVRLKRRHVAVLARYLHEAEDPEQLRRRLARNLALSHVREGEWAEARPHLLAWWRRQPRSMRALRLYLRSLLARGSVR